MGDVLSQNEIDNLLSALNSGDLTQMRRVRRMIDRLRIMILRDHPSSQKSICERLNLFLSIMPDFFPQICQYIFVRTYRLK